MKATVSSTTLSGEAFDARLVWPPHRSARLMSDNGSTSELLPGAQVYHLADAFQRAAGVNVLSSRKATQRLRLGACKAKELLSTSDEGRVRRALVHHFGVLFNYIHIFILWAG